MPKIEVVNKGFLSVNKYEKMFTKTENNITNGITIIKLLKRSISIEVFLRKRGIKCSEFIAIAANVTESIAISIVIYENFEKHR